VSNAERGNRSADLTDALARRSPNVRAPRVSPIERFSLDTGQCCQKIGGWLPTTRRTDLSAGCALCTAEAAADPIPVRVHALSGQLVQATDQWVALRHARLVLLDDLGLARGACSLLAAAARLPPAVAVLDAEMRAALAADRPCMAPFKAAETPEIPPSQAMARARDHGAILVDLRSSLAFRKSHVDGAVWTVRPMADRLLSMLKGRAVLLIADDAAKASLVAADLAALGASDVSLVDGGHDALVTAGAPTVSTPDDPTDTDAIDHLFFVHDRHDGNLEASRRYLAWETGLVHQMDEVERAEYHLITP
jgi:rhodanese-related sulfurtransferase